jgi:uncharacterized repeat protein (TIGR03803 family)
MGPMLSRYALSIGAAALLAACAGSQAPINAPGAIPESLASAARTETSNYKVVYSFNADPDGNHPVASLIDVGGTLYGTTKLGGTGYACGYNPCGTVFSVTSGGTERVLYSFGSQYRGYDGALPVAAVTDVNGTLYGTTSQGGSQGGYGTVFSLAMDGTEKVLHNFSNHPDGSAPLAALIEKNGMLYGTTRSGGSALEESHGTVFSITTGGTFKSVYTFLDPEDGVHPNAALIDVKGMLYGTTGKGGWHNYGAVFSLTPSGTENTLHSFGIKAEGRQPLAALIAVKGIFYGTTTRGGSQDRGTVFSMTPSGTVKVLHSFGKELDGANPVASLIVLKGTLYGTTESGGAYGGGTVFSITTSGKEQVLHSFGSASDGASPQASLTGVNGTLYGTTEAGGSDGQGTVFALTP